MTFAQEKLETLIGRRVRFGYRSGCVQDAVIAHVEEVNGILVATCRPGPALAGDLLSWSDVADLLDEEREP